MDDATEVFQPLQADDPPVVAGYRLAARLGAGGMGRVYLSHTPGGRPVAIKVVRPELADAPDFRRRFGREIAAARRVRGAYTAELIDADADGVPPWLATVYVPGPSLADAVARRGPLPVPAVLWLMAGVAEALQAVHAAGIVHRDLKPSNVLLAADGPRVIDFGISLASGVTAHTATGTTVGTPQFMAPEQATAGEITAATDIFALGQTAAFAALGEPLYGDGPSVSVLYRIVHSSPDLSVLPERLRPLIARCLAAAPEERITPAEVVAWCRRLLGRDADAGGGPAVWREFAGREVTVPAPLPDPTPVHTLPLLAPPRPPAPAGGGSRGRRAALVTAAVTTGALVLTGLAWKAVDAAGRARDRDAAASSASDRTGTAPASSSAATPSTAASSSGSGSGTAPGSGTASGSGGSASGAADPASTASATPRMVVAPGQWLDEKTSLSFEEPVGRKNRKGDIRMVCGQFDCSLKSDRSVFVMLYGDPAAGLDGCRILLPAAKSHDLPLAAAAAGSAICVRHPSGDIALLVVQVKSTALGAGGSSFVTMDMTIERAT